MFGHAHAVIRSGGRRRRSGVWLVTASLLATTAGTAQAAELVHRPTAGPAAVVAPVRGPRPGTETFTDFSHSVVLTGGRTQTTYTAQPSYQRTSAGWRKLSGRLAAADGTQPLRASDAWEPVTFGVKASSIVSVRLPGGPVTLSLPGAHIAKPARVGGVVTYRGVAAQTDLEYTPTSTQVKEQLVLRGAQAPTSFTFHLADPAGILGSPVRGANESWTFSKAAASGAWLNLAAPAAWSTAPHQPTVARPSAGTAHQQVVRAGDGWNVTLSVDKSWLKGKRFPIILDPSIGYTYDTSTLDVYEADLTTGTPLFSGSGASQMGNERSTQTGQLFWARAYIHADISNLYGRTVQAANLALDQGSNNFAFDHAYALELHAATHQFTVGDPAQEAVTDEDPAVLATSPGGVANGQGGPYGSDFDITTAVQNALVGSDAPAFGFVLQAVDDTVSTTLPFSVFGFSLTVTYTGDPVVGSTGALTFIDPSPAQGATIHTDTPGLAPLVFSAALVNPPAGAGNTGVGLYFAWRTLEPGVCDYSNAYDKAAPTLVCTVAPGSFGYLVIQAWTTDNTESISRTVRLVADVVDPTGGGGGTGGGGTGGGGTGDESLDWIDPTPAQGANLSSARGRLSTFTVDATVDDRGQNVHISYTTLPSAVTCDDTGINDEPDAAVACAIIGDGFSSADITFTAVTEDGLLKVTRTFHVTPSGGFSGALPLLLAHGITNTPGQLTQMEGYAKQTVPDLNRPGATSRVATGAVTSVWVNAGVILGNAQQVLAQTGAPEVNVLAHSKGGLDARVAISEDPSLFSSLGMLSTPNGGSAGADKLCRIERIPGGTTAVTGVTSFGPCKSDADGLYDLQTGYVKNVINDVARDEPSISYYDLGSNCSTHVTSFKCNALDNLGISCGFRGGDSAVCLDSAYWLTSNWSGVPGGQEVALPFLEGYSHDQMRDDPCPVTDMLAELYPRDSVGNPWVGGNGAGCASIQPAAGAELKAATTSTARRAAVTAAAVTTPPAGPWVDQATTGGTADAGHPFVATVDPEGGGSMLAQVFVPVGVTPTVTVTDTAGHVDTSAVVTVIGDATDNSDGNVIGAQTVDVSLTNLQGAKRIITVAVDQATQVGLATAVNNAVALDGTVTATPTGSALVTATLSGLAAAKAKKTVVQASYSNVAGQRVTTTLAYNATTGAFTGLASVPSGSFAPIDLTAQGASLTRNAGAGVMLPTGGGQIGKVAGDSLVDTDGDGEADTLQLPVGVTVAQAGDYHLTLDLAAGGKTVVSGQGEVLTQAAGPATVNVDVPLKALLSAGTGSGAFEAVNGTLTVGTDGRSLVARATDMGPTATYNLDAATPASAELSALTASNVDANHDGVFDALAVTGSISVPTAGAYHLTGNLEAPDGSVVDGIDQTLTLSAGRNPLSASFAGTIVGTAGSGTFTLVGVAVTDAHGLTSDPAPALLIGPLNSLQWTGSTPGVGGLRQLWSQANTSGAIHTSALYLREGNRLDKAVSAAAAGKVTHEKRKLDAFIVDVQFNHSAIDVQWWDQILYYARAVRRGLGS